MKEQKHTEIPSILLPPDFLKKAFSGHSAKVVKAIEEKHGTRS